MTSNNITRQVLARKMAATCLCCMPRITLTLQIQRNLGFFREKKSLERKEKDEIATEALSSSLKLDLLISVAAVWAFHS